MLIPEVVTARPLYEFMQKVKLFDTYPGLIILYISAIVPFTVLILKNFVGEIPVSLEEAASPYILSRNGSWTIATLSTCIPLE